jgi:glycerophosphoryl diester phosphodiesterase
VNAETITFPDDTLIMGYGGKWYQLTDSAGNTSCSYAMGTTAVNVVYQISTGAIFAQAYSVKIDRRNQILLCSIRKAGWSTQVSISCNYTLIKDGVTYNNLSLKEATRRSSFLAPLITGLVDRYAVIDTNAGTITFPDDTLIIDPCGGLDDNAITYQLSKAKGNTVCKYSEYTGSSAVKIFYNPETDALEAAQYNIHNSEHIKLILLATMRVGEKAVAINIPYIVDGLLNGVDYTEFVHVTNSETVKSVNHRGYCTDAPENTLAAFRLSKKKGFTHVECDVSFTSDGYAVLLHDSTVDRTSNGTGNIANMTLEQVRALDFGSWKSAEYAGEQIPTFEEFIALCKHLGLHPYIEVKTGTEEQIQSLVNIVKRYGMKGKVTWISFSADCLGYVKAVDPKVRLGFVVDAINATTISTIKQKLSSGYNEVFVDCSHGNATADAVQLCADADIPLEVWTVNSEAAVLALDAYVSGVTSDNIIASNVFYDNRIGG